MSFCEVSTVSLGGGICSSFVPKAFGISFCAVGFVRLVPIAIGMLQEAQAFRVYCLSAHVKWNGRDTVQYNQRAGHILKTLPALV